MIQVHKILHKLHSVDLSDLFTARPNHHNVREVGDFFSDFFSDFFLAILSKSPENTPICQSDHVEAESDHYFHINFHLQGQNQGQRTGNGPEGKVTDRFGICLYQNIPNHDG